MAKTADYQLGQFTYPRGWLMVASSASVTSVPDEGRFFGEDVVLYRGESGKPVMLDAYCPHMGAHLAVGPTGATAQHCVQVVGDAIRCPNHGWIFGADGKCREIPYSDITIPDTLRIRSWRVQETGGMVFVWHDEEGGEPTYELPAIPQWDDLQWLCSEVEEMGVWDVHPMELAEHGVDKIHLANVHGSDRVVYHAVTFDDHCAQTTSRTATVLPDGGEFVSVTHSRYTGPGFLRAEMEGERPAILVFCHTPVEDGKVRSWHAVMMKARGDTVTEEDRAVHQQICQFSRLAFEQDLHIFQRKKPSLRPVEIPGDPPFRRYRQWYGQFYRPRSETAANQGKANGVVETRGIHTAPWIAVAN
ncbi:MAG: Rieske 2Fe-2S domain-containing protein [Porticoccaceae bacterium]